MGIQEPTLERVNQYDVTCVYFENVRQEKAELTYWVDEYGCCRTIEIREDFTVREELFVLPEDFEEYLTGLEVDNLLEKFVKPA